MAALQAISAELRTISEKDRYLDNLSRLEDEAALFGVGSLKEYFNLESGDI